MREGIARRDLLAGSVAGAALVAGSGSLAEGARGDKNVTGPEDLRKKLLACLGGAWPQPGDLRPVVRETIRKEGYRIESVTYEAEPGCARAQRAPGTAGGGSAPAEPGDRVPALLLVPDGVDANHPAPAVAVWHQHNGAWHLGKVEPAGLAGSPMHHTGVALAREGYVVLCPDALCFGERQSKDLRGGDFERFEFLRYVVAGKCMAWKNILDMRRAVDYLCSRPEVKADRIGCYGHSMGSTDTWLVGPWEPRLKCLVGNCCLPTYAAIHRTHLLHCFPNFIPGWFQYGDTPDIAGLIAPRALHLNFGAKDDGSPIQEVREGVKTIARAYEQAGAADRFSYYIEEGAGHVLSPEMWRRASAWFHRHLSA